LYNQEETPAEGTLLRRSSRGGLVN
jgi:hypothetical protein